MPAVEGKGYKPQRSSHPKMQRQSLSGSVDELSRETRLQPKVIAEVWPMVLIGRFAISAKRRCSARSRANLCAVLSYNWALKDFLSWAKNLDPCIFRLKVACRMHWTGGTWRDACFEVRERQKLMADIIGRTSRTTSLNHQLKGIGEVYMMCYDMDISIFQECRGKSRGTG